jgi:hypothetical protein
MHALNALTGHLGLSTKEENSKQKLKGHDQTQSDIFINVENTNIWFTLNPMGKSKLGDLVRTMAEKAALDGRKVNHSARKTTITSLLHSNKGNYLLLYFSHRNFCSLKALKHLSVVYIYMCTIAKVVKSSCGSRT